MSVSKDSAPSGSPSPSAPRGAAASVTYVPMKTAAREEEIFPTLTPVQMSRIAAHGRPRPVAGGEILASIGDPVESFFVVRSGSIEFVRRSAEGMEVFRVLKPGQFTGEINILSGRSALVDLRVGDGGELIDLHRDALLALVQTDSELSDLFMRAFILRRVELIAHGFG